MTGLIVDLYAGPGGWSEGLRALGLTEVGIELDPAACATRAATGHRTIRADVTAFPLDQLAGRVWGLIASPPCQAFSTAGKGDGRDLLAALRHDIDRGAWDAGHGYPSGVRHVLEVGRWVLHVRPRWIAAEQVPPVLPLWEAYADRLRDLGYSTWAGILCAADYGVPQTRRRAILMASLDRIATPPAPTHAEGGASTLLGDLAPWVSMATALGWTGQDTPARTIAGHRAPRWMYPDPDGTHGRVVIRTNQNTDRRAGGRYERAIARPAPTMTTNGRLWAWDQPATTVAGDPRITARCHHDDGTQGANAKTTDQVRAGDYDGTEPIRLTLAEALILQGFRADYPVQGTKTKQFEQVGNAVPPPLAAAILGELVGIDAGVAA